MKILNTQIKSLKFIKTNIFKEKKILQIKQFKSTKINL